LSERALRGKREEGRKREDTSTSPPPSTPLRKGKRKEKQQKTNMSTLPHLPHLALPTRLIILILSLSAVHVPALTTDAHTHLPQQQQQYNRAAPNAALDSNPAQIPLAQPLPLPPIADADPAADAEGPQTQPKVRRCGWEIMEDGEFPFSLFPFPSPLSLPLPPYSV
jgi:hypothetical protein